MKKTILFAAPALLFAGTAHAEAFNGPYVGAEIGHDNYEIKASGVPLGGAVANLDGLSGNGIAGGVYAGYDVSFGSTFVGVEANLGYSDADASISGTSGGNSASLRAQARETYGASARLGFKVNPGTGLYAKLGYANTRFKGTVTQNGASASDSSHEDGFVYGAGLETGVSQNLSLRVEYTIADYGDIQSSGVSVKNSNVRAGLSFRF